MSSDPSTDAPIPPEPFGQIGIRRYLLPAITVCCFILTCAAGLMSFRSMEVADSITYGDGVSTLVFRSVFGRVLITHTRFASDERSGVVRVLARWSYAVFELPEVVRDGWQDSWKKRLGIEWRGEALVFAPDSTASGWWLRIRWRSIVGLSLIVPIARAVAHQRRVWRQRRSPPADREFG